MRNARELTRADSGSLFLLETNEGADTALRFAVAQTGPADAGTHLGAVLPLTRGSISGYVAMTGDVVRIPDAYEIRRNIGIPLQPVVRQAERLPHEVGARACRCATTRTRSSASFMLINRKPDFEHDPHLARND